MPAQARHSPWTEEEFYTARDAAPPGERWELVDGEVLVTPAPHWLHQRIVGRLLVVPSGELRRRSDIVKRLLLAAEIVSPSSARLDRVTKRPHYQRNRVSEYWIVDDMSQTVERWTPDEDRPELLAERLVWHPAGVPDPFVLELGQFFKDVAAED